MTPAGILAAGIVVDFNGRQVYFNLLILAFQGKLAVHSESCMKTRHGSPNRANSHRRGFGGIGRGRAFTIGNCFAWALAHLAFAALAILALAAAGARRFRFRVTPADFGLRGAIIRSSPFIRDSISSLIAATRRSCCGVSLEIASMGSYPKRLNRRPLVFGEWVE